jgi:DNA-binding IclR family transcriptional regulator
MPVSNERLLRARELLLAVYARTGGMPSIAAFAKEMGYSAPSSAFELTEPLVAAGFLAKSPSGRLLPGPKFHEPKVLVPDEMLALLPAGVKPTVVRVPDDSMVDAGILEGDSLVVVPYDADAPGLVVQKQKGRLLVSAEPTTGWTIVGHLVAQFRSYR